MRIYLLNIEHIGTLMLPFTSEHLFVCEHPQIATCVAVYLYTVDMYRGSYFYCLNDNHKNNTVVERETFQIV